MSVSYDVIEKNDHRKVLYSFLSLSYCDIMRKTKIISESFDDTMALVLSAKRKSIKC